MKTPLTTRELVDKARDPAASLHDQHAAFSQLVAQSQHIVFGLALTSLHDVEDAKDVVQDAFMSAWRHLGQLHDGSLFPAWLRKIVATQCLRRLRRRARSREVPLLESIEANSTHMNREAVVTAAVAALPGGERDVTVLFYFLGYSQTQIAHVLRLKPGTVGKRLHSARLRVRRKLPRSLRADFVGLTASRSFVERVQLGLFDEYVGQYRFAGRPEHVVSIVREGNALISQSGDQRHLLLSVADDSLLTTHYDGEGRFGRNRRGQVTHFVYYEFGKRLGIARKIDGS